MIHGVKFLEWTLKALRDLPVCVREQDGKDWLNNLYRCSSFSLPNGDASVMIFGLSCSLHALAISLMKSATIFQILCLPMQLPTGVPLIVTMITPYLPFTPCFLWDPLTTSIGSSTGSRIDCNKCWVLINGWRRASHHDWSVAFFPSNLSKHFSNRG